MRLKIAIMNDQYVIKLWSSFLKYYFWQTFFENKNLYVNVLKKKKKKYQISISIFLKKICQLSDMECKIL